MKLLLSWIFDHIEGEYNTIDVSKLITKFNTHTAEIETFQKLTINKAIFEMVYCEEKLDDETAIFTLSDKTRVILPKRSDIVTNYFYLVKKEGSDYTWATLEDFGKTSDETLLSPMILTQNDFFTKSWKAYLPADDIIFDVDNKSLTNRPDMWGHRGFAREIAFLLDMKFKDISMLINPIVCHRTKINSFTAKEFTLRNEAETTCTAFSLTKFKEGQNTTSNPMLVFRLAAIGQKAINAFVDLANYVMHDFGHPVHTFDAKKLNSCELTVRFAKEKENITLLGNTDLILTTEDLVVADNSKAVALAGIKGGADSAVTCDTQQILFEVANFRPEVIRRTSMRSKIRTDASARFEKTLDSEQIPDVVARFIALAKYFQINIGTPTDTYFSTALYEPKIIEVEHAFLETFSGLSLTSNQVTETLGKLEFVIQKQKDQTSCSQSTSCNKYLVEVPSFRATKNIQHKEDILEEISRCIGFSNIPTIVPEVTRKPYDLASTLQLRSIKRYLAYGANMVEQVNYPFYDEDFLHEINYRPEKTLTLANPVSENQRRLVQSLIPGLLKNAQQNKGFSENLGFFEIAKIWPEQNNIFNENKVVAGVFISKKSNFSFYEYKAYVEQMLQVCKKQCVWQKQTSLLKPWQYNLQTADILLDKQIIGTAGTLSPTIILDLGFEMTATGFTFELLTGPLLTDNFKSLRYQPLSKFPASYFDISMFVPPALTVDIIKNILQNTNSLIQTVSLLDVFEKKNEGLRSLTFRILLQSYERNIEKTDLDLVNSISIEALQQAGATIRT